MTTAIIIYLLVSLYIVCLVIMGDVIESENLAFRKFGPTSLLLTAVVFLFIPILTIYVNLFSRKS